MNKAKLMQFIVLLAYGVLIYNTMIGVLPGTLVGFAGVLVNIIAVLYTIVAISIIIMYFYFNNILVEARKVDGAWRAKVFFDNYKVGIEQSNKLNKSETISIGTHFFSILTTLGAIFSGAYLTAICLISLLFVSPGVVTNAKELVIEIQRITELLGED